MRDLTEARDRRLEKTHAEEDRDHLLVLVTIMAKCLTERQVKEVMAAWKTATNGERPTFGETAFGVCDTGIGAD